MKPWTERPFEIRNLFNPAFCGVLLLRAVQGYEEIDKSGLPFSLSLLILPMCLHKNTREILSENSRSNFLKIITDNPNLLVGFAGRTTSLIPYAFEGLGLAMQHNSIKVTDDGHINLLNKGIKKQIDGTTESIECQRVALKLGKSFATISDRITIYTTMGIRP
ncbi:MAG: three component ABC system middle component [Syntrophothermus sp.]